MTTQEYINKLKFIVATFEECLMRGDLVRYSQLDVCFCAECESESKCSDYCRIGRAKAILEELREEKI